MCPRGVVVIGRILLVLFIIFTLSSGLSAKNSSKASRKSSQQQKQQQKRQQQQDQEIMTKPRILCLHGKFQSGAILSNKIAGARRKLARVYDLDFLDAPIVLPPPPSLNDASSSSSSSPTTAIEPQLAWWVRNEADENILVQEALEYVLEYTQSKTYDYDAILGFSQGGTLATALALSGQFPNLQAVVTAGSPYVSEAYDAALQLLLSKRTTRNQNDNGNEHEDSHPKDDDDDDKFLQNKNNIPKLHFAGENDTMVPVESTKRLCEVGGNGEFILHEKGHLFPTKAVYTNYMLEFLSKHVVVVDATDEQTVKKENVMTAN